MDRLTAASTRFEAAESPVPLGDGAWNIVGGSFLAGNWWCNDGPHPVDNLTWTGVGADKPYLINSTAGAVDRLPLFIPNNYGMC